MSGFEIFREVRASNAAAAEAEQREADDAAQSNPERTPVRENVPLWMWRAAARN